MHRIYLRLIAIFVVIVTVVLTISGTYSQYKLSERLEMRDSQLRLSVLARLQISLPPALWNLDKSKVDSLLESEMIAPEVEEIRVYDADGSNLFSGKIRNAVGKIVNVNTNIPMEDSKVSASLAYTTPDTNNRNSENKAAIGHIEVKFSRAPINAVLSAELKHKILEILALDLILVVALSFSLRMVFVPLTQLRDSLNDLATHETEEVEELPENRRDEFGEVAGGFNRIQRKLKSTIENTRQAEDVARRASVSAEQALQNLRTAQNSLVQAERLASLGGLVAGVAHEINTPLGITLTGASTLQEATELIQTAMNTGNIKKSEMVRYLETAIESSRLILGNTHRAAELIQSFKQIAVDQTNEIKRPFNVKEYIEEVLMCLAPKLKKTKIQVSVNCATEIELNTYSGAFAQILTNLIMNALTHAYEVDDIGHIDINVQMLNSVLELSFCDDGKGIPAEYLGKIFDPFFTTKLGKGGSGLGLNIVYNLIAKQLDGSIIVESVLGKGTRFIIRIPCSRP
ncbi:sensor histidine kinase [Solimicrobium silvestre]|uniref:histidine kinase n=1 Tax=Solimicrobium silvestre TaxID=2099400 RepID=A0A2S9GVZ3_9BURK|nr:HAMP domain-containing sensor histidine kinase [Solimicrobium silvestre]PRC91880.1 Histidine kinase-, DNA gyrase B-, and HSP90-like ATPase [Solimicrobium silvestre]